MNASTDLCGAVMTNREKKRLDPRQQRKKLKLKLDKLVGDYVKRRDGYTCQKCGRSEGVQIQWAHFISRSVSSVRWDEENSCALCAGCHAFGFAHRRPKEFAEWWAARLGLERTAILELKARNRFKNSLVNLQLLYDHLKKELA